MLKLKNMSSHWILIFRLGSTTVALRETKINKQCLDIKMEIFNQDVCLDSKIQLNYSGKNYKHRC